MKKKNEAERGEMKIMRKFSYFICIIEIVYAWEIYGIYSNVLLRFSVSIHLQVLQFVILF